MGSTAVSVGQERRDIRIVLEGGVRVARRWKLTAMGIARLGSVGVQGVCRLPAFPIGIPAEEDGCKRRKNPGSAVLYTPYLG